MAHCQVRRIKYPGKEIARLEHPSDVTWFQIVENDLRVATICGDEELRIWNIQYGYIPESIRSSSGITTLDSNL